MKHGAPKFSRLFPKVATETTVAISAVRALHAGAS